MSASFNVLTDPWIPVVDFHGRREELGILPLLERAHELQGISDASPLVEFGLYRLLFVFLTDALRPGDETDLLDLLDAERFDMEKIRDYVTQCQAEGASFDLFDEKRPFLQTPYKKEWDRERKPVSTLDCTIPSGNNHTHFDHRNGKEISISFAEAARLLPAAQLFCTAGAQGYPSGVNGAPPYFMIIQEENLFRALICGLGLSDSEENMDDPLPVWRWGGEVESKKVVVSTSWLFGMLFPTRRILLIPDDNANEVSTVYYSQGMNYQNTESWTDQNVSYRVNDKGRFPIRPNRERAVWRNLVELINEETSASVLKRYRRDVCPEKAAASLTLFGAQTDQASFLGIMRHDFEVPKVLAMNPDRLDTLKAAIGAAEDLEYALSSALKSSGVIPEWGVSQARQEFYEGCDGMIWNFCGQTLASDEVDHIAAYSDWCSDISKLADRAYDHVVESCRLSGKALAEVSKEYRTLKKKEKTIRGNEEVSKP